MPNKRPESDSVGHWAKRLHLTSRSVMEAELRPYGIGTTQWYVLYRLMNDGPTTQRDLARSLEVERATISAVVAALVRKGLVGQQSDASDQRRRLLTITADGRKLWRGLPDLADLVTSVAFDEADPDELETARAVLQRATNRLADHLAHRPEGPRS